MGFQIEEFTSSMIGVDNTTLAYAVKNPLSFVFNSISPNDWYVNSETYQNDVLWGAGVNKSAYDPCPKRWRVPTNASLTYGDFSVNTMILSDLGINVATGRTYNSMAWFPSGGYRRSLYGTLGGVGGNGYYWSVSVNGTSAKYLNEGMSGVNPSAISNRAAGFSKERDKGGVIRRGILIGEEGEGAGSSSGSPGGKRAQRADKPQARKP